MVIFNSYVKLPEGIPQNKHLFQRVAAAPTSDIFVAALHWQPGWDTSFIFSALGQSKLVNGPEKFIETPHTSRFCL